MNITVYLGANEGNDPALRRMIDTGLSSPERQQGIYFAESLMQIADILNRA